MSNWVFNYVKVYGKNEDLQRFKNYVALSEKAVFSFQKFIDQPEDTSSWAASGVPGWYMWGLENWGTKWDCWDAELSEEKDHLSYKFITAYDFPEPIFDQMIEKYKNLDFKISIWESVNYWTVEIAASGGDYIKYNYQGNDSVHWKKNLYIDFRFNDDFLDDNKIEIIKAEIYKQDKNLTTSKNRSGSNQSKSNNTSAAISVADLDDDELLAALDHL